MLENISEKRSEFRFPVAIPVEYFNHGNLGTVSYCLDISRAGAFISSDSPLEVGNEFPINLTIPVNSNSSKIIQNEGAVTWKKLKPYKSVRNGMGVKFVEKLSEKVLLDALTFNVQRLVKESNQRRKLEKRLEELELRLYKAKMWSVFGGRVEKIMADIAIPLTNLCKDLVFIKEKIRLCKNRMEEERRNKGKNAACLKEIIGELDNSSKDVSSILGDYNLILELININSGNDPVADEIDKGLIGYNL
ncbi:MAG: PilZ domain-containing protein [Deltaproteobacteria bacterium]|nr:PilZ domain-containing protein [Deltaproteobacteria bacterium]